MKTTLSSSVLPVPEARLVQGRDLADKIKQRSTLAGLVEPAGIVLGLAGHPSQTFDSLGAIAGSVIQGDLPGAGREMSDLADRAVRPDGVGGAVYNSGLALKAGVNGLVGSLEVYEGVRNGDLFLGLMGAADLVSGASHALLAAGVPAVAMALSLAAAAAKATLVLVRPGDYSRIQKAKTVLDSGGAVSSTLLKTGYATGLALAGNAVFGLTQILYMNHDGFRARVDRLIDWLLRKGERPASPEVPAGAEDLSSRTGEQR